jgi:hypothetical protein
VVAEESLLPLSVVAIVVVLVVVVAARIVHIFFTFLWLKIILAKNCAFV